MKKACQLDASIKISLISLSLFSGIFMTSPTMAASVTFAFQGVVNAVDSSLFPSFNVGQTLSGSYTFESTTPLTNPGNRYNGAITSLNGTLGSYSAVLGGGNNFIAVRNNLVTGDHYIVSAPLSSVPAAVPGLAIRFRMELIDPSVNVFTNTSLPTTPPSLGSFATNSWRLVFEDSSGTARIRGSLTSLTAIPLPAAVILFGCGLIALIGLGAGSWRQKKSELT